MTLYLTVRALCILAFVAGFASMFASACFLDDGDRSAARRWCAYGFGLAVVGCVLVGFGWGGEHP